VVHLEEVIRERRSGGAHDGTLFVFLDPGRETTPCLASVTGLLALALKLKNTTLFGCIE
jgi:hypothetical protein